MMLDRSIHSAHDLVASACHDMRDPACRGVEYSRKRLFTVPVVPPNVTRNPGTRGSKLTCHIWWNMFEFRYNYWHEEEDVRLVTSPHTRTPRFGTSPFCLVLQTKPIMGVAPSESKRDFAAFV